MPETGVRQARRVRQVRGATASWELSVPRGVSLYVGALLGPGLLMLPGIADQLAGPASILAWAGLLLVSGLFALVFTALGVAVPGAGGVVAYASAGLGRRVGRSVGWCFVTAVILGAPVVCLIGAGYITAVTGGGRTSTAVVAALLLALVTILTLAGTRIGTSVQMGMIALLLAVIVAAVAGSLPAAHAANWTPFAPHGWSAIGSAASVLMLSFVGWEAVAPLTRRVANPRRALPRITATSFAVTAVIYLALAASVVAVLGPRAATTAPIAALMRIALGAPGPYLVAGAAALLTLATVNAYLTGAAALTAHLRAEPRPEPSTPPAPATPTDPAPAAPDSPARSRGFFALVAAAGLIELAADNAGLLDPARMVTLPTALFLIVYIGSTASAVRLLPGPLLRLAAIAACAASALILAFCGFLALFALLVAATAYAASGKPGPQPQPRPQHQHQAAHTPTGPLPAACAAGRGPVG
jgi:amino acid efflux transporter